MKVAWVTPRWAADVRGGAETAARETAERLAADPDWTVEAFTSRAVDHFTWANALPEGDELVNGVVVHRFTCSGVRFDEDPDFAGRVIHRPRAATLAEGRRWVDMQGPSSPELVDAVAASNADLVIFTPYLFAPTVQGVPRVGRRALMAAAAHDEPLLRLRAYQEPFREAAAFVFYSPEERGLVERVFRVAHRPASVIGIGVEAPSASGAGRELLPPALGGRPYVVCLGRVEEGKGSPLLARYFEVYKDRNPGPLQLVFAGPVTQPERYGHPDVHLAGMVDEETKWALLRHAEALVSPSPYESFSLVLMEGWLAGLPALVNGRCDVTRGHAKRSAGGLWFDGFPTFEGAISRILGDRSIRDRLADRGRAYVEANFTWPVVIERYRAFLQAIAQRV